MGEFCPRTPPEKRLRVSLGDALLFGFSWLRGRSEAVFLGADLGAGSGNQIFNQIMNRHLSPTDENFAWLSRRKSLEKEKAPPDGNQEGQAFSRCFRHAAKHRNNKQGSTKP